MKGEYEHSLDAKGRLFIPVKLREELGDCFVVTKGLDGCLFVYAQDEWDKLEQKIDSLPMSKSRDLQRFFLSSASDVVPDKQGRILIPPTLRRHARLEKEVTIIGVSRRAEIWSTAVWEEYNSGITESSVAEAMEELGF
ncbi:MAG: division/cell wall cluster transcriptional repressor MraZ [Butyricicoccaceae bacterium]